MLFLLGTVVFAIDVADVMAAVAVSITLQEGGATAGTSAFHQPGRDFMHRAHILYVHARGSNLAGGSATENGARCGFLIVRVLVVLIVLADVNHRQLPQLG